MYISHMIIVKLPLQIVYILKLMLKKIYIIPRIKKSHGVLSIQFNDT